MVLILPSETRINLKQLCSYKYNESTGCVEFLMSAGVCKEEKMHSETASVLLPEIDKALDGRLNIKPLPLKRHHKGGPNDFVSADPAAK